MKIDNTRQGKIDLNLLNELLYEGYTIPKIAKAMSVNSSSIYRRLNKQKKTDLRLLALIKQAKALKEKGMSLNDIAKEIGVCPRTAFNYVHYNNPVKPKPVIDEAFKERMSARGYKFSQIYEISEILKKLKEEKKRELSSHTYINKVEILSF